uniref:Uncharacterized protein n=1 Tax=Meloidogyne enterolobii TaxID=390850 RepID=A0A6V7VZC8_MELEN|nr:unnamed protein product [Meloidogyne enterolobii]
MYVGTDLFANGGEIDLTIRISNYYIWILFDNLLAKFITKLWPTKWWKGKFLTESEIKMKIHGDFIMATPLFIKVLNDSNIINIYNKMYNVIEMPYSARILECTSNESFFNFRFIIKSGGTKFSIKLFNGVEEVNPYGNFK